MENKIFTQRYLSPCGELLLGSLDNRLCMCNWIVEKHPGRVERRLQRMLNARFESSASPVIQEAAKQLDQYFGGERKTFDVPLLFAGTLFQKQVWNELLTIPYGSTLSYAALAAQIGAPSAVRAVANANGANAISLFVPCHRVIGSDHTLTGYGGGMVAKKILTRTGAKVV